MIHFETFTLENGLHFVVHSDNTTPIVAMNIIYKVGAKDEQPNKTGLAHLFEHLMFSGSAHIPRFDTQVQRAGGENNAFTNSDFTNYYIALPKENIETAFWLESDRMLSLSITEKTLDVQRQVVAEEFRQNYLNRPYGDAWLLLKPLCYKVHPYQWNTIGKDIEQIENTNLNDVKQFYKQFYTPNNAIVSIVGDVNIENIKALAEKWFGPIPTGKEIVRSIPAEPPQLEARTLTVKRSVPSNAMYKVWHMCSINHTDYYASDLISDLLGTGQSSPLFKALVLKQQLFSEITAFISGDCDPGMLIITGMLLPGVTFEMAERALMLQIELFCSKKPSAHELLKVKNRIEAEQGFTNISALNKAKNLGFYTYIGRTSLINELYNEYRKVRAEDVFRVANEIFKPTNCNTLYYLKEND